MRTLIIGALCATLVASLGAVAPAIAAPSVIVTAPASTSAGKHVNVVYSGVADAGTDGMILRAFYEVDAENCGATAAAQRARAKSKSDGSQYISDIGPFTFTSAQRFDDNGAYRFCAYLETWAAGDTEPPVAFSDVVLQVGPVVFPCIVPQLRGLTLKAATKKLRAAHCSVGRVTKPRKTGKKLLVVKSQAKSSGTRLASGAEVNLVLKVKTAKR